MIVISVVNCVQCERHLNTATLNYLVCAIYELKLLVKMYEMLCDFLDYFAAFEWWLFRGLTCHSLSSVDYAHCNKPNIVINSSASEWRRGFSYQRWFGLVQNEMKKCQPSRNQWMQVTKCMSRFLQWHPYRCHKLFRRKECAHFRREPSVNKTLFPCVEQRRKKKRTNVIATISTKLVEGKYNSFHLDSFVHFGSCYDYVIIFFRSTLSFLLVYMARVFRFGI